MTTIRKICATMAISFFPGAAAACFPTPDSRPLLGCMPFNFSAPMDWGVSSTGEDDGTRPELVCYRRSGKLHARLIERLYGQMMSGDPPDAFSPAVNPPDLNGDKPYDFGATQSIKEFTPDFVRAYYPPLYAIVRDFESCMQDVAAEGCGGVEGCRLNGFVFMGYLPEGRQYPVVGMPEFEEPCDEVASDGGTSCPDPLWEALHPEAPASSPLPSRKPVLGGIPIPARKPDRPATRVQSEPELVVIGDVGMMMKPSFQQAWSDAFRIRLADHYDLMANHAEDAAAFTALSTMLKMVEEAGPRQLQRFIEGNYELQAMLPTLQEGRRVLLDNPDLTDAQTVFLRAVEGMVMLLASIGMDEGMDKMSEKLLARGMAGYVIRAGGGLALEASWQAGTVGSIAYFAYKDAVADTQEERIPDAILDMVKARVLPNCKDRRPSIPGHAVFSSMTNFVQVRLALVDCDWYEYTEPCTYGVGCDVMQFKRDGDGWVRLMDLNSDRISDAMMVGRTRPYELPDIPLPPEVENAPRFMEIWGLKDAMSGTGARLDAER